MGIVDESLPTDGCTWLFKVDSEDDEKIIFALVGVGFEEMGYRNAKSKREIPLDIKVF